MLPLCLMTGPLKSDRVIPHLPFPALWDGPTATYLAGDAETSPVGRRKSGVFLCLEIKPNRVFLFWRVHTRDYIKGLSLCPTKWPFVRVRRMYKWTEAPWADRPSPLKAILTSTRKSWKISQRNTEKTTRQHCLCTHLGRFGWTGKKKNMPTLLILPCCLWVWSPCTSGNERGKNKNWRPQFSAGLRVQM